MKDKKVLILVIVLGLASILFGVYLFYTGIRQLRKIIASQSWLKTKGIIKNARLAYNLRRDSDGDQSLTFFLIQEYTYTVSGIEYFSDQRFASDKYHVMRFHARTDKEKELRKKLKLRKLKSLENREELTMLLEQLKGEPVEVFYNPENHKEACLFTKIHGNVILQLFASLLIFAAGNGLIYLLFNQPK